MEIEEEQPKEINLTEDSINEIQSILGMHISKEYIKDINNMNDILSLISFSQKEYSDIKSNISSNITSILKSNSTEAKKKKEEEFFKSFQLNTETKYYHTAEKDEISPTMSAFYFCEKSNQIISDKEAAARKLIHLDTNYEHFLDNKNNDFEEISISSNNQNSPDKIGKKRKMSPSTSACKSGKKRKTEKSGKNNKNENDNNDSHKYCISTCLFGRNSGNCLMIECERCKEWFHPKCVGLEEKLTELKEMVFYCPNCSMFRQNEEQDNINNNTNNDIKN